MARNLVNAGHDVTAYDLDRAKVEELARSGATPAISAEELARNVDVLFTSLPGPRQAASARPSLIDALSPARSGWT
jgi:3-hydroxyisobutyrate dehydrogenase-like beta-hydroxyacid dehydrogenase